MDGFSNPIGDYDDDSPCPGPQMKLFQTVLWAILARAVPPARFPEETEVQTVMKGIDLPETTKPLLKLIWGVPAVALDGCQRVPACAILQFGAAKA